MAPLVHTGQTGIKKNPEHSTLEILDFSLLKPKTFLSDLQSVNLTQVNIKTS